MSQGLKIGSLRRAEAGGFIIVFVSFFLLVLFGIAAIVLDVGNARVQKRRVQVALDAGALAGVNKLSPTVTDTEVKNEAVSIANANLNTNEVQLADVTCGRWAIVDPSTGTYGFQSTVDNDGDGIPETCSTANGADAVAITHQKTVSTAFGKILRIQSFVTSTASVARANFSNVSYCIKPFGIQASFLNDPLNPVEVGETFTIEAGSGNWGKLNISGSMNGKNDFIDAMTDPDGVCSQSVGLNLPVNPSTGDAGVPEAFDELLDTGEGDGLFVAVTSEFSGGGSVLIENFAKVDLIDSGEHGSRNWFATFRLVELPTTPPNNGPGTITTRDLVR